MKAAIPVWLFDIDGMFCTTFDGDTSESSASTLRFLTSA
jgi:hypothetical protein